MTIKNLFINASQHRDGQTAHLAEEFFFGKTYDSLDLVDYNVSQLGRFDEKDQFDELENKIKDYQLIVIGTPVYWSMVSGLLKTWMDRHVTIDDRYRGKDLFLLVQGDAPEDSFRPIDHTFSYFASRFAMNYSGIVTFNNVDSKKYAIDQID